MQRIVSRINYHKLSINGGIWCNHVESLYYMFLCTGECIGPFGVSVFMLYELPVWNSCAQQSWRFLFTECQHNVHLKQRLFSLPFFRTFPNKYSARRTCANIGIHTSRIFMNLFRKPDSFLSPNAAQAQKQTINYSTDFRGLLPNEFFHLTPLLFLVSELKKHSQSEVLRVLSTSS